MNETIKVGLGFVLFIFAVWLFVKLSQFIAYLIDKKFQSTSYQDIISIINKITVLLIFLFVCTDFIMFYSYKFDEGKLPAFFIVPFFTIMFLNLYISGEIKDLRMGKEGILFKAEVIRRFSKKSLLKWITITFLLIFGAVVIYDKAYHEAKQLMGLIVLFPILIFIAYFLVSSRLSEYFSSEDEYQYNKYIYNNEKDMLRHKNEIESDKPRIREAIKNRDLQFLYLLAQKYKEKEYSFETSQIIDEIDKIDKDDFYAKKARELVEVKNEEIFIDDSGRYIGDEAANTIIELEKNLKIFSPKSSLAIAEAYRNYRMTKEAIMNYESVIMNYKRSKEAKIAQKAIEELRIGKTGFTNIN